MLTDKQAAFVQEYLIDLNATQAAIRAGYSATTAEQAGSRLLLMNVEVAAAVNAGKKERSERTRIDADWMLLRLDQEVHADIGDLYDEAGALKPVKEWPLIWRQGLVAGIDVEEVREEGVVVGIIRKVKLSDRAKRLELIGKHVDVSAFEDRVKHSGTMAIVVSPEDTQA